MPTYEYKAVDKTGAPARGGLDAVNEVDLELRLRRMGLDLITYQQVEQRKGGTLAARGKVTRQDLINLCFDLEQMIRSGIPILDLAASYMIGDKPIDIECGRNAGVKASLLVRTGYGAATEHEGLPALAGTPIVDDIAAAVDWILDHQPLAARPRAQGETQP